MFKCEKTDGQRKNLKRIQKLSLFFLLLIAFTDFSSGQIKSTKSFNLNFNREAALVGAGAVTAVTAFAVLENLKPLTNDQIELLEPSEVNGFDRGAIGPYREDYVGDAVLYASYFIPVSFLFFNKTRSDLWDLALMYGEVLLLQSSINGIVKGTVQRTRPYVYDDQSPIEVKLTKDAKVSFFSGHTSMTAAISFFTARVFTEYVEDSTVRILIWSGAALLPAVTAISRVNSHWHFPTDVIAGYVIGAMIGYFIPELHKTKSGQNGKFSFYPAIKMNKPEINFQLKF